MGSIRIISGRLRGRVLSVANIPGLRPTPSRLRAAFFDWLGDLDGVVAVDLFAGSGALGLEALSRGAKEVIFIEHQLKVAQTIAKTLQNWKISPLEGRVIHRDAISWLAEEKTQQPTLWLLDPPFHEPMIMAAERIHAMGEINSSRIPAMKTNKPLDSDSAMPKLLEAVMPKVPAGGVLYWESPKKLPAHGLPSYMNLSRHWQAGQSHAHALQRSV